MVIFVVAVKSPRTSKLSAFRTLFPAPKKFGLVPVVAAPTALTTFNKACAASALWHGSFVVAPGAQVRRDAGMILPGNAVRRSGVKKIGFPLASSATT